MTTLEREGIRLAAFTVGSGEGVRRGALDPFLRVGLWMMIYLGEDHGGAHGFVKDAFFVGLYPVRGFLLLRKAFPLLREDFR